ncbi:MAG: SDR family oxidoreductase [Bdellovibrionota bacterium]
MDIKLNGQTALVTGSTEGIGFAIARELGEAGASVVVNGRNQAKLDRALSKLEKEVPAGVFRGVAADLATPSGAESLKEQLPEVDILVNNVGIFEQKDFFAIEDEAWDAMFQINVMSGVRLSRYYLPKMLQNNRGRILFISSETAVQTPPDMIHYGFSKTAQLAVARGLAELTKGTQVTVNSVLPGPTRTEGVEQFVARMATDQGVTPKSMEEKIFQEYRPSSLIQRFAEPREVAYLVTFLASPLAASTNGASLRAEGGILRSLY